MEISSAQVAASAVPWHCVNIPLETRMSRLHRLLVNDSSLITARNPPPICADVPKLKQLASLCLEFKDLDITDKQFSGISFLYKLKQ